MNHVEEEDLRVPSSLVLPQAFILSFGSWHACLSLSLVSSCFCALLFLQTFSLCVHIFTWSLCIQFLFVSVVCFRVIHLLVSLSSSFPLTMQCWCHIPCVVYVARLLVYIMLPSLSLFSRLHLKQRQRKKEWFLSWTNGWLKRRHTFWCIPAGQLLSDLLVFISMSDLLIFKTEKDRIDGVGSVITLSLYTHKEMKVSWVSWGENRMTMRDRQSCPGTKFPDINLCKRVILLTTDTVLLTWH